MSKLMIDELDVITEKLTKAMENACLLGTKDYASPVHLSTKLREEIILPLKDIIASAENLEERILNLYNNNSFANYFK